MYLMWGRLLFVIWLLFKMQCKLCDLQLLLCLSFLLIRLLFQQHKLFMPDLLAHLCGMLNQWDMLILPCWILLIFSELSALLKYWLPYL